MHVVDDAVPLLGFFPVLFLSPVEKVFRDVTLNLHAEVDKMVAWFPPKGSTVTRESTRRTEELLMACSEREGGGTGIRRGRLCAVRPVFLTIQDQARETYEFRLRR